MSFPDVANALLIVSIQIGNYVCAPCDSVAMHRLVIALALVACGKSSPEAVAVAPPATIATGAVAATGSNVAVAAPKPDTAPRIPPTQPVAWQKPTRAPNDQEQLLAGTWAAKVGDYASRSAVMADKVMFALDAKNPDLFSNAADAIDKDKRLASNCVWIELRADFTGFRRECAIVNGEPTALDQTDFQTGAKKDFGTKLEWFIDSADKNKLKIHFADDMLVPAMRDGKLVMLVFRTWWLQLDKPDKAAGDNHFFVKEWFPEHDYQLPTEYTWQVASGYYLP
jgi:hypothetical protein